MAKRFQHWRTSLSLRFRLVLVLFGVLTILLLGLGALISFTEEHALLQNQANALREEVRLATINAPRRQIVIVPDGATPPQVGALQPDVAIQLAAITQRLTSGNVRATMLTPQGDLLITGDLTFAPLVVPAPAQVQNAVANPPSDVPYLIDFADRQRQLVVLQPLIYNGTTIAVLAISTPTAPFDQTVAMTRLVLGAGIFVALALAIALTWPLVGAALQPLAQMERTSARIARGDLSLRLAEPPTDDEIGLLAHSFNYMVAELEAAFARQKQFVADASHELRTPLTVLRGGLEMMLIGATEQDREAARRLVRGMYGETQRMQRLVDDLLILTRIDGRRLELHPEAIDAGALIRELGDEVRHLAHGQAIITEVSPDLPALQADPDRLRQVLLNLIGNAIKFTPPTGTVTIAATPDPDSTDLRLSVSDTGVGIAPEALPHVFDRFYRADPARSRSGQLPGGSGLGLAIARGLVEAMGGTITIQSVIGEGTTVTVTMPTSGTPIVDSEMVALTSPQHIMNE